VPKPTLTNFLKDLTTDGKARKRYRKNPREAMKKAGLSAAHQKLILSGDAKKMASAIAAEQPEGAAHMVFTAVLESSA
jgi:hypothetical protein